MAGIGLAKTPNWPTGRLWKMVGPMVKKQKKRKKEKENECSLLLINRNYLLQHSLTALFLQFYSFISYSISQKSHADTFLSFSAAEFLYHVEKLRNTAEITSPLNVPLNFFSLRERTVSLVWPT